MTLAVALLGVVLGVEVELQPGAARPGDAVMVSVRGVTAPPSGQLGSTELTFLPFRDGYLALVGLSVDQQPGELPLEVTTRDQGVRALVSGSLEVRAPNFRKRQLTVSKRFTSISAKDRRRSAEDQRAFSTAMERDFEPATFDRAFVWPRLAEVTAPFGDLRLLNGKKQSQHFGTDLDGERGDPIEASNDGEVVMVRSCFASGNTVLIHHGHRLFSAYFHLTSFEVKEGERVKAGQRLGTVGKTGRVTGPHLHFGFKLDGRWVDPQSVLRLQP